VKVPVEFEEVGVLPDGWSWQPLQTLTDDPRQDIVDGPFGSNLKASEYVDKGVPIARLQNVDRSRFINKNIRCVTEQKAAELDRHRFEPGDILLTKLGDPLGKACIVPPGVGAGVIVADLVRIRPSLERVDRKYLSYALNSPGVIRQLERHTKGTTRPRVNLGVVRELPIPVAPRRKQESIVAEIEKQFSRLDEAVANLKRVEANLKHYRAAVLKDAVEGRLVPTEAELALREGRIYETGAELLQRVLDARRSQWYEKGKYKEPAAPNAIDLPRVPNGWTWARLDAIATLKGGITVDSKRKNRTARSVPYLRVANVQRGYLDLEEVKRIDAPAADIEQLRLLSGDILFTEGGDRDKLGRGWIWDGQLYDCIHQNHIFRARLFLTDISPKFISWWGNSFGKDYFLREGKQTTNLASINLTKLGGFPVPLPPLAEQLRIVAEVERCFSFVRDTSTEVSANVKRALRLRNSILQRAFC
jgi:type I restriction enzyme S subunit